MIQQVPILFPDFQTWDLEGRWDDVNVQFIDARFRSNFEIFRYFHCTTIKLVNLDSPAVRFTFYSKHKYWLKKPDETPKEDTADAIDRHISSLHLRRTLIQQEGRRRPTRGRPAHRLHDQLTEKDLEHEIDLWTFILANLDEYQIAQSSYERKYMYITVNWKYQLPTNEFANSQEHLLNSARDPNGQITKLKTNILFVDTNHILRPHPNQNKEIEMYLENFPLRTATGVPKLYARKRL